VATENPMEIKFKMMNMNTMKNLMASMLLLLCSASFAQPVLETGGQKMPDEWIDKSTGHRLVRLSRIPGSSTSFYFHNNPFVGNKMLFIIADSNNPVL